MRITCPSVDPWKKSNSFNYSLWIYGSQTFSLQNQICKETSHTHLHTENKEWQMQILLVKWAIKAYRIKDLEHLL